SLLQTELIDVIYVEAGLDPNNKQQCHYRKIEDFLSAFDYRIFRLYEQKNEWLDDSPLLRRVNVAFMSRRFANENPLRLTNELFEARKAAEASKAELSKLREQLAAFDARHRGLTHQAQDPKVSTSQAPDALTIRSSIHLKNITESEA